MAVLLIAVTVVAVLFVFFLRMSNAQQSMN